VSVRITVLVEDEPAADEVLGVEAEHGLSLLVETDSARVLFDAGSTGLVARNAEMLGLENALARLDAVVLSHGHYDHTGGLAELLRRTTRSTPVFVRPGLFAPKAKAGAEGLADIGVPVTRGELEQLGGVVVEESGPREVLPGFFVSGEIALAQELEAAEAHLLAENVEGEMVRDAFPEEQALVMKTERGVIVLIGCAHRGLLNSVAAARKACGESRVQAILGGAHLRGASREHIEQTVDSVVGLELELVALGHCTGKEAEERFAQALGERSQPLRAGASWMLA
jgi:7,8-dihydropterin-6-yl-methyl-4-(beta-D-ribofuranosyl)aminobenzene 5'-phosphate synthase